MLAKIKMNPGAARLRTIDYSEWLQAGETITGALVASIEPVTVPPLTVIADVFDPAKISVYMLDGLADTVYTVGIQATTTITIATGDVNERRVDCLSVEIGEGCS